VGRLTLLNRLRSNLGREVSLVLTGAGPVSGRIERVGVDWALLSGPQDVLVVMAAVASVADLPRESVSPSAVGAVASRLTFASALRAIAVDRSRVTMVLTDGTSVAGTPDRVGADFVDVAVHPDDVAPRATAVTKRTTVAYRAISTVVREPDVSGWG
jgi:hypothetical protein